MNGLRKLQEKYAAGEARAIYELVLGQRFGLSRTDILLGKDTTLSEKDKAELQLILERVVQGEPVQYVLGHEEFCGHDFLVGPSVLIPRSETQQLVALVQQEVATGGRVLDIGTGSGCIAISLALAGYRVMAMDISSEALVYARKNAERLGAEVKFVQNDILTPADSLSFSAPLDCIISNPPYICEQEAADMEENVLQYEPHLALFVPDDDPLRFYRAIGLFGQKYLACGGHLFFEINAAYGQQVEALLLQQGYVETKVLKDQFDMNRFVCARKK